MDSERVFATSYTELTELGASGRKPCNENEPVLPILLSSSFEQTEVHVYIIIGVCKIAIVIYMRRVNSMLVFTYFTTNVCNVSSDILCRVLCIYTHTHTHTHTQYRAHNTEREIVYSLIITRKDQEALIYLLKTMMYGSMCCVCGLSV